MTCLAALCASSRGTWTLAPCCRAGDVPKVDRGQSSLRGIDNDERRCAPADVVLRGTSCRGESQRVEEEMPGFSTIVAPGRALVELLLPWAWQSSWA